MAKGRTAKAFRPFAFTDQEATVNGIKKLKFPVFMQSDMNASSRTLVAAFDSPVKAGFFAEEYSKLVEGTRLVATINQKEEKAIYLNGKRVEK
jgi:hypothetical protein